ncbi:MAG: hypothetical protein K8F52_14905 [Candidatus Scalindua rubra]|uniref:Chain length determinant protein n=1 Tax=Candidatus Scalindua brodae TaxID=237368 RepID=A0A0B0EQ92_9BACT|nr:MAG: Chain length determinant protein [Candidatus Scalindua brodae]MBZ0109939.1 hypothetical protein [Candidatus Scalindua rubra]TWU35488.1 Chain length determinant protein [Candidatus Brocadiaceae bacterium S225]
MTTKRNIYDYLFNIDLKKYFEILSQQKGFVLCFCLSAIITSLALTYLFSEKYVAGITIYYRPVETSLMRMKDVASFGAPAPTPPFRVIVQTLVDIVRSDVILRPLVTELGLDKEVEKSESGWIQRWYHVAKDSVKRYSANLWLLMKHGRIIQEEPVVSAIKEFRENINIRATKDSYIYVLTVKDQYPERAAKIVDTVGVRLVEWLTQQGFAPALLRHSKLEAHLEKKADEINKYYDERHKLLTDNNIISVKDEIEEGITRLYELETEYIRLDAGAQGKTKMVEALLKSIHDNSKSFSNPDYLKDMEKKSLFEKADLQGLIATREAMGESIDALKMRLQTLLDVQSWLAKMNMKNEASTRRYINLNDLVLESFSQTYISECEVKIMHHAEIPLKPVQPIKIYHVGLTLLLGLCFSVGMVYVFAFFNIRTFFVSRGVKGRRNDPAIK